MYLTLTGTQSGFTLSFLHTQDTLTGCSAGEKKAARYTKINQAELYLILGIYKPVLDLDSTVYL